MIVLAIDTASACSVAIARDGEVLARRHLDIARGHAEALLPMIQATLTEAGLGYPDIDLIAAATGPGSFTGLRTGLAAARGLALALGKPTLGISSFESIVHRLKGRGRPLLVALETKRADVYVQVFDAAGAAMTEPLVRMPEEVASLVPEGNPIIAGDAAARLKGVVAGEFLDIAVADAATVAFLAAARYERNVTDEPLKPLYLAPPATWLRADGGALRP